MDDEEEDDQRQRAFAVEGRVGRQPAPPAKQIDGVVAANRRTPQLATASAVSAARLPRYGLLVPLLATAAAAAESRAAAAAAAGVLFAIVVVVVKICAAGAGDRAVPGALLANTASIAVIPPRFWPDTSAA